MSKILIVEDDLAICELLAMNFRLVGHQYLTANSAESAGQLCQTERFDLLLLDVMLPDGTGFHSRRDCSPLARPLFF